MHAVHGEVTAPQLETLRSEFDRREWSEAYQNAPAHPDGFALQSNGCIPPQLEGTYFRNGPGLFTHGNEAVLHPFDGHGLVASIAFRNGRAFFRSRYIETKDYNDEVAAGRILYPGTFGTKPRGGLIKNFLGSLSPRNPANTGLIAWAGKYLALFEAGQPHSWCPDTLKTKAVDLLGGNVKRGAPFSTGSDRLDTLASWVLRRLGVGRNMEGGFRLGGHAVSAHPVEHFSSNCLVLFSFRLQPSLLAYQFLCLGFLFTIWLPSLVTKLRIHEFNEEFEQQNVVEKVLPGYTFLHDISVTPEMYVVFCNSVRLRMLPLILGLRMPAHCIEWTKQPANIHLIQRPSPDVKAGALSARSLSRGDSAEELLRPVAATKGSGGADASLPSAGGLTAQSVTVPCPSPAFVFHQANAFCSDDATLVVDCIRYPTMPDFRQGASQARNFMEIVDPELQPISQLFRYTVDLARGTSSERLLSERAMEFPTINPDLIGQRHRYVYTAGALHPTANRPQQAICKLDLDTEELKLWSRGLQYYTGEPVFVPSPNGIDEDDGWILSINYDAKRRTSECVILSASDLSLLAAMDLKHILPHGLHGVWDPVCHAELG